MILTDLLNGGFVGLGAALAKDTAANVSAETHQAIFGTVKPQPATNTLGFADKALITAGVVILSMFALSRVLK